MSLQDDMLNDSYTPQTHHKRNVIVGAVFGVLTAAAIAYAVMGCGAGQTTPAQDARVGAYGLELDECTHTAKTLDASTSAKIATDNACQCAVAAKYGWADSGVLGCTDDGGVK